MKKATRVEWSIMAIIGCHGNERDACHVSITGEMAREMPREKERERENLSHPIHMYIFLYVD